MENRLLRTPGEPDELTCESIRASLINQGCNVITLYSVDSTNNEAKRLAAKGAPSWTIVAAEVQTGGRGRYGRSFYSPLGCGAYFSLLLRQPEIKGYNPTLLTVATSVAVCLSVEKLTGLQPEIKWVNDLYLHGKKVCGILSEALSDIKAGGVDSVVIGIGVNISMSGELPDELNGVVGALFDNAPPITRSRLIAEVSNQLHQILSEENEAGMLDAYRERSFLLGKEITFTRNGLEYSATAIGIDDSGALVVRFPGGSMDALQSGEVSIVRQFL